MDPRESEALVQRLVHNPHDQDAINQAHQAGQTDPKAYALLLEKVGTASSDPAFACHWLTESANVWITTLGDAHRAARALMIAIDRDPTQSTPAERLAELYREKGDTRALVALLERRAKALGAIAQHDPALRPQLAAIHEELGQLWAAPPLAQPKKAIDSYKRAVEYDDTNQYSIYAVRELLKGERRFEEAIPYFDLEQRLVSDAERQIALYQDEGEVRKLVGDFDGAAAALRSARQLDPNDASLKQQLATVMLEKVQANRPTSPQDSTEGAELFVELSEAYPGEHGFSYAMCALEIEPQHDRAMQLVLYYGEQLGRSLEAAARAAAYLKANPNGAMVHEARKLVATAAETSGDEALIDALAPSPDADAHGRAQGLLEQAQALLRKAKKNEAAAKYREVLALEPGNEAAVTFLEPYLRQTRKFQDLRDVLLAAARDESAGEERRAGYYREVAALCETQLRDTDTAATALQELLALDASDEAALTQLKRLLEKAQRWDQLATVLGQEAEQVLDVEARISLEKALAKLHEQKRGDLIAAGEAWARIANLATGDDEAVSTAVEYFEKGQRPELAIPVISDNVAGISDDERRSELLEKLGELRQKTGDALRAGEAYVEAAKLGKRATPWEAAEKAFVAAEAWDQAASAVDERAQLTGDSVAKAALFAAEAGYLSRAGDDASAVLRLEQATELDPKNEEFASAIEERYRAAGRTADLAAYLLARAEKLEDQGVRSALRRRVATIQRDDLKDPDGARATLTELLRDGDDAEALAWLSEDAEARGEASEAVEYLERLIKGATDRAQRISYLMRQARLTSEGLGDAKAAIALYERVVTEQEGKDDAALAKIAELYERLGEPKGRAEALERRLKDLEDPALKLEVAESLAQLYEGPLDDAKAAVRVLDVVRELDPENFDAAQRLCELCEKLEDWPRVATLLGILTEVEGDEAEVSKMLLRRAEILDSKAGKSDEALAVLMEAGDRGDEACRQQYVVLGDRQGWKGVVATKLVEWYMEAPVGPARTSALKGAFERFVAVDRYEDAVGVAKELGRTRGVDADVAKQLEEIAVKLKDLDALAIAHDAMVADLSGRARAEEMVRQAEVLLRADVSIDEALQHGEQALTSVAPAEVEPLLQRLAKLAEDSARAIGIYERQIGRCKAPADKLAALTRASGVAAEHGAYDKARAFFDLALGAGVQEDVLSALEQVAITSDNAKGVDTLRRTLADAMASGGQGLRDGGRTRGMLLGRAALLVYRELKDVDKALGWLGDAIVTHVDDERLDALSTLAKEIGEPRRAEAVLTRALEEVFDGPLVRKLLARRAALRRDELSDKLGAAADLKRLHDLSPSDSGVTEQLSSLYTELADYRGMVQLFEDQILRGKDPGSRAELARQVARLWQTQLDDPREAADAWRRVLRMKAGDPEATEGLERAKHAMLTRPKEDSEPRAAAQPKAPAPIAAAEQPATPPEPARNTDVDEPTARLDPGAIDAIAAAARAPAGSAAAADDEDKTAMMPAGALSAIAARAETETEGASEPAVPEAPKEAPAQAESATEAAQTSNPKGAKLAPPPKPKKGGKAEPRSAEDTTASATPPASSPIATEESSGHAGKPLSHPPPLPGSANGPAADGARRPAKPPVPPPPRGAKPPARGAAQVAPPASVPIATYKAGNSDVTEIRAPEALADEDEDEDSAEFDVDDDELIEDQPT